MTGLPRKASSEPDLRGWTFRFLGARRRAEPIQPIIGVDWRSPAFLNSD
jgi:hypothetical protein